jgi:hypothetical protein
MSWFSDNVTVLNLSTWNLQKHFMIMFLGVEIQDSQCSPGFRKYPYETCSEIRILEVYSLLTLGDHSTIGSITQKGVGEPGVYVQQKSSAKSKN